MSGGQDSPAPVAARHQLLAFRLPAALSAAASASALDGQLTEDIREAFTDGNEDVHDDASFARAVEDVAIALRPGRPV